MRVSYYPGCTLNDKARNLDDSTKAAAALLGIELEELPTWTCCGATHPLTEDRIVNLVPQVRILSDVRGQGLERVTTTCAFCYNTLKRANKAIKGDEITRRRINAFLKDDRPVPDYERDTTREFTEYGGEVEVVHLLEILRDDIGFEALSEKMKIRLEGLAVAPYYGCQLLRPPEDLELDDPENPSILEGLIGALGAELVDFPFKSECCGSYISLSAPEAASRASYQILRSANRNAAEVIILSCPLCWYNMDARQGEIIKKFPDLKPVPVLFFTQLLALGLGAGEDSLGLDCHAVDPRPILKEKGLLPVKA